MVFEKKVIKFDEIDDNDFDLVLFEQNMVKEIYAFYDKYKGIIFTFCCSGLAEAQREAENYLSQLSDVHKGDFRLLHLYSPIDFDTIAVYERVGVILQS